MKIYFFNVWFISGGENLEEFFFEEPEEDENLATLLFKSDHEFSPESDLEDDDEVKPAKFARTAKKGNFANMTI